MCRALLLATVGIALVWAAATPAHAREEGGESGQSVTVFLREGKRIDGIILGFVDGKYRIDVNGKVMEIPEADVRVIIFDKKKVPEPSKDDSGKGGRAEGPGIGVRAPQSVNLWMDAQGRIFDKPLDGGGAPPGGTVLMRVLIWDEVARILGKAVYSAPEDRDLPVHEYFREPLKLTLKLDSEKEFRHFVGVTYCGKGTVGLMAANRMIADHKARGGGFFSIDFHATGVPASWFIQTLRLVHGHEPASVFYTRGVLRSELEREVKSAVELAGGSAAKYGDVTVKCVVHKDTPYERVAGLLLMCAHMGIRKVFLGLTEERMVKAFLPVDQGVKPVLEEVDAPKAFIERFGGKRNLRAFGGGRHTESAVLMGLIWLKNHQNPDGLWSCRKFQFNCPKGQCTGGGSGSQGDFDMGVTGLAALAFLGGGHTTTHGKFKMQVEKALTALMAHQTSDGCFGPKEGSGHWIYNHAVCTLAMAEAYGLTKDKRMRSSAQRAVDFLVGCQNPYLGWRYGVRTGENDSSCTAWAVSALHSAKLSGLNVPEESFAGALNWYDKVTDEAYYRTGYTSKGDNGARLVEAVGKFQPTDAMTAAAVFSRILILGTKATNRPRVLGGGTILKQNPPKWDVKGGTIDMYYWYWGTLAMFQLGRQYWKAWNGPLKNALVPTQRRQGCENGSWDPVGAWGTAGGRVYSTALSVLCLQVYYRYARVFPNRPGVSSSSERSGDPVYDGVVKMVLGLIQSSEWERARKVIEAAIWDGEDHPERVARLRTLLNDVDIWERNWKRKKAQEVREKAARGVDAGGWVDLIQGKEDFAANWSKAGKVDLEEDRGQWTVTLKDPGAHIWSSHKNITQWFDYEVEFEVQSSARFDLGVRIHPQKRKFNGGAISAIPQWKKIAVKVEGVTIDFTLDGKSAGSQPCEAQTGGIYIRLGEAGYVKIRNLRIKINKLK